MRRCYLVVPWVVGACTAAHPVRAAPPAVVEAGPELLVERAPEADRAPGCEVLLYAHDQDAGRGDIAWVYRLELSKPDSDGRSTVQRVLFGGPWPEVPAAPAAASARVWEVDSARRLFDGERFLYPNQPLVDWTVWPLSWSFVAPRMDRPDEIGGYQLSVRAGGPVPKEAWGGCVLALTGPGGGGCAILQDVRGDCVASYEARHGLGAR